MVLLKHKVIYGRFHFSLPPSLPKVFSECAIAFGKVLLDSIKQTLPDTGCPFCNVSKSSVLKLVLSIVCCFVCFCVVLVLQMLLVPHDVYNFRIHM